MTIKKTKKLYDKMNVRLLFWKARTAGFLRISLNVLNILVMYSRCFKFFYTYLSSAVSNVNKKVTRRCFILRLI